MSDIFGIMIDIADILSDLVLEQAEWSQATFGSDSERGPVGVLKHLELEAREAQQCPTDITEYADCLLCLLDASRRAGIKPLQLFQAAYRKLQINKTRTWSKPVGDEPAEHIRSEVVNGELS